MPHRLFASRWRHVLILLPLGAAVGCIVGLAMRDLWFGVRAGVVLGGLFGLLLAIRNPKPS